MLAKCIQISAKVSVAEGSVKGKAFGVGGNPQSKAKEGVERVSAHIQIELSEKSVVCF